MTRDQKVRRIYCQKSVAVDVVVPNWTTVFVESSPFWQNTYSDILFKGHKHTKYTNQKFSSNCIIITIIAGCTNFQGKKWTSSRENFCGGPLF